MKKENIGGFLPIMPLSIVATKGIGENEVINFAPHGQIATVSNSPSVFSLSVRVGSKTSENILQTGKLSINIPSVEMIKKIKTCGSVSGKTQQKNNEFLVFYGENDTPMVKGSLFAFNCEVVKRIQVFDSSVFFIKVLETFCQKEGLGNDKQVQIQTNNLLLYGIDGKFYNSGKEIK